MTVDTIAIDAFYASQCGAMVARLLTDRLLEFWPQRGLDGLSLLGYGYAYPFLGNWSGGVTRCLHMSPANLGVHPPPPRMRLLACLTEEDLLPLADLSIDRILLVHGLESADNARRLLRELWRVLKDDGRLLMIAPNRHGIWAHIENTPFGQGQPYTPGQVGRLMADAMFRVERRDTALFIPPGEHKLLHHAGLICEKFGRKVLPRFGGVTMSEAVKDIYAALPTVAVSRRRVVLVEAA